MLKVQLAIMVAIFDKCEHNEKGGINACSRAYFMLGYVIEYLCLL